MGRFGDAGRAENKLVQGIPKVARLLDPTIDQFDDGVNKAG